ncbi:hypothetical protein CQA01_18870 [Cyclobacterium qasimii]|uniref:Uncharacterized protein n=2 Tax=Cyclobacterium qasimii TaxID=1350429 RepID=A0A512CAW8_9BACT|nr:hypothetical protein CQA01_18870 [Cyclobacterium qasimii]
MSKKLGKFSTKTIKMSKDKGEKKDPKKKAGKSLMEKRADKKAKELDKKRNG